ncbi:sn-glycerol-3-phosphate ABC transporter ATP-binding protein UgpC [bacterium]|nr:sn-glycerol-3-phosphate ABC transporter ATP-binding protein UgpC [bacterium]
MIAVEFRNIIKSFGDVHILKEINLQVREGEFLVLVGPSGCGKSTSLRLIAGLEDATSGELLIHGKIVNDVDPSQRDIAMVFQSYALYPHLNVFENMAFGLRIRKTNENEIQKRVQEAAEILKITNLLDRKPKELSGGQRQRVALGRAIVRKPRVFLFDEPLSNLDAKLRGEMRVEIKRLHQLLGNTMVYVTHDQVEAMTMGDRIAIMNKGVIEQLDTPKMMYAKPLNTFVAGFIGTPQMNFLEGEIFKSQTEIYFKAGSFKLNLENLPFAQSFNDGKKIILGVRPENIFETENSQNALPASVELIEPLGSDVLAHLVIGGKNLTARFKGDSNIEAGNSIKISFEMNSLHFFDKETTQRLN